MSASVVLLVALVTILVFRQRSVTSGLVETPAKPPAHFIPVDPNSPAPPIDIYGYYSDYNSEGGWTFGRVILYYVNSTDKPIPPQKFVIKYGGHIEIKEGRSYPATLFINQQESYPIEEPDCLVELNPLEGNLIPVGIPFHIDTNYEKCPGQHGWDGPTGTTFYFRYPHTATPSRLIIKTEPYDEIFLDLENSHSIYTPPVQNLRSISDLSSEFRQLGNPNITISFVPQCGLSTLRDLGFNMGLERVVYIDYEVNNSNRLDNGQLRVKSDSYFPYWPLSVVTRNTFSDVTDTSVYGGISRPSYLNNAKEFNLELYNKEVGPGERYRTWLGLAVLRDYMSPPSHMIFVSNTGEYRSYKLDCR